MYTQTLQNEEAGFGHPIICTKRWDEQENIHSIGLAAPDQKHSIEPNTVWSAN